MKLRNNVNAASNRITNLADGIASGDAVTIQQLSAQTLIRTQNGKGFVNHGSVATTARPSGYASIEWSGTVSPNNAIDGDTWIDVS